jgi:protoheme IX farnesyltransferase
MTYSFSLSNIAEWVKIVVQLGKIRISQLVAMSTLLGYILAAGELSLFMLVPTLATFLLSCGSAALNQYQEREYDRLMERTRLRPISSGRITPVEGLLISFALIAAGSVVLFLKVNTAALGLGWLNILWYNGIYTPLKRKTPFAVIPGSLIGAIPPAIGWVAGGESLLDPRILAIGFFFLIWQVPHFWLLLLTLGRDYEKAGFPSLTQKFTPGQLARITYIWIIATAMACLLIPLFGIGNSSALYLILFISAGWLVWDSRKLLHRSFNNFSFRPVFKSINIYILIVMLALSIERLLIFYL